MRDWRKIFTSELQSLMGRKQGKVIHTGEWSWNRGLVVNEDPGAGEP